MKRILIIDDDFQVMGLLRDVLLSQGFDVSCAPNGEIGLLLQKQSAVDVLITDLVMPDTDGYQVIRQARKLYPELKIIAISGGDISASGEDYLPFTKLLGADAVFTKPINHDELISSINDMLNIV